VLINFKVMMAFKKISQAINFVLKAEVNWPTRILKKVLATCGLWFSLYSNHNVCEPFYPVLLDEHAV